MINETTNLNEVSEILKKYFKGYLVSNDPFEKVIIYTEKDILGILSYSIIYERAEINYIITIPKYRRKGIGSKLLEYALNDIKNKGCQNVSLEVLKDNKHAIYLYSKYGFKVEAVRENYYHGKDAYLMVKKIEVS